MILAHHRYRRPVSSSIRRIGRVTGVAITGIALIAGISTAFAAGTPTAVAVEGESLTGGAVKVTSDATASGGQYATVTPGGTTPSTTTPSTTAPPNTSTTVPPGGTGPGTAALSSLPKAAKAVKTYLEPGVLPPTNEWFASLAFDQSNLQNVFAYPLAIGPTSQGFGLSYPKVVPTADSIFGAYAKQVNVDFGRSVTHTVAGYDDLSVGVNFKNGSALVAKSTFTQGSPFAFTTLQSGVAATVTGDGAQVASLGSNAYSIKVGERTYVVVFDGATASGTVLSNGVSVTARANNALLSVGVVADGATPSSYAAVALNAITSTTLSFAKSGNTFNSTVKLNTVNGQSTLFAPMPEAGIGATTYGSYSTINGTQPVASGTSFAWTTSVTAPPVALNLSGLTAAQKTSLAATVHADATSLAFTNDDTYFGFKDLQRAAELLDIAKQIGATADATLITSKLRPELETWLDFTRSDGRATKYFTYDTNYKGIVGQRASFGSDEFNDHVFHYGYLLNAAAIYSRYDSGFVSKYGANVNLIAKDISNTDRTNTDFTYLRPFDQYAGRSWASGTSPFSDGNNQESSSEAVNGWYGLYRWAVASGNATQANTALYLYARESSAALRDYLNFNQSQSMYSGYNHSIVSLVWGGKKDYATWFSPAPAAKLGIQLLPMSPGQNYVGADPARVTKNLQGVAGDGTFDAYLLMYQSFANPTAAQAALSALPDAKIDGALTRSYVQAWLWAPKTASAPVSGAQVAMVRAAATTTATSPTAFRDDFDGTGLPGSAWLIDEGTGYAGGPQNGFGTDEIETMTRSTANINQQGGKLYITPIRNAAGAWTSGRIETQAVFKPASGQIMHMESSLAFPDVHGAEAAGYWPAFWSMGETQRADRWLWPANGEFDFAESVNGINKNWSTLHCGYRASWGGPCNEPNGISNAGKAPVSGDIWGGFHNYSFEWDRSRGNGNDQLRWYVDGVLAHTVNQTDAAVRDVWGTMTEHNGYFMILNVAIGGQFPANQGGGPTAATKSGVPMIVDYVEVRYLNGGTSTTTTPPTTVAPTTTAAPTTTKAPTTTSTTVVPSSACTAAASTSASFNAGTYKTWVRIKGTAGQQVHVGNGSICTTVSVATSNAWTWVPVSTNALGDGARLLSITVTSGSVDVDRILVTPATTCTPTTFGSNCATTTTSTTTSTTRPPSSTTSSTSVAPTTTAVSSGPLTAPSALVAAASSTSIKLTWKASTGGTAPYRYQLLRAGIPIGPLVTTLTTTDANLAPNTPYLYSVVAVDAKGVQSAPSNVVSVKTLATGATTSTTSPSTSTTRPPTTTTTSTPVANTAPVGLVAQIVTSNQITLAWAPSSGATSYQILRSGIPIATSQNATFTDVGLMPGTTYIYSVKANRSGVLSPASTQLTVVTK